MLEEYLLTAWLMDDWIGRVIKNAWMERLFFIWENENL